jgi:hypothetical protein
MRHKGLVRRQKDGAGSATTQEETTVYKEETTLLGGPGGIPEPPDSTLSYGGREIQGMLGSYCWSSKILSGCADAAWPLIPITKQRCLCLLAPR